MKVLHVAFGFPPDPPGGTELYVEALCHELAPLGVESVVAAPAATEATYEHRGLRVRRFAITGDDVNLDELYGGGDLQAAASFERILDEERPDLLHQHALTSACSGHLVRLAKKRGLPVVFTYHTPTVSCQRGTLLEWGRRPCDGQVSVSRCTPCTLHGLGLDGAVSSVVARTPELAGDALGKAGLSGGAWTALRMRSLMRRRYDHLAYVLGHVDTFVSLTPWVRELLAVNGVEASRITDCAHGVFGAPASHAAAPAAGSALLRIAHLGRLEGSKGTRLLIDAVRAARNGNLRLDVFGVVQNAGDAGRLTEIEQAAAGDERIRILPAISHSDVVATLSNYDLVAVPSQGFETGPLVVIEAFAAGVPVLGSALGGIADKVAHGKNGWLVKPHDAADAWQAALSRCASDGYLMTRLKSGVRKPRRMADVARDMNVLYVKHLSRRTVGRRVPRLHPSSGLLAKRSFER